MITTSIGVQELSRRIGEKAKADPRHRFWGLYTHVWKLDVLEEAYRLAKENRGAPGVDGVTFSQIETDGVAEFLQRLSDELRDKTYRPLACRQVEIPKSGGKTRTLRIPAIRDRVVQGSVRLIMQPIFEADFQPGSFGYRPNRTAHQALDRVKHGLNKRLHQVIDIDLKSYFDTVRHDLLLSKLARRIRDGDLLWLCKSILKSGGKRGLPQGSVIGPLWANVFLNDVDKMLEQAQIATKRGPYETVRYARFADDLIVLVSGHPSQRHWATVMIRRLKEEFGKLDVTINEDKSSVVDFAAGAPVSFLGYVFRWEPSRKRPGKMTTLARPQKERRIQFLRALSATLRHCLPVPVDEVVRNVVNPRVRGWVNYFRWGNSSRDLQLVRWHVETKVRRFATRQRPKKRKGGRGWTTWRIDEIYGKWNLFDDYHVSWCSESGR
jgi:RNA-directed DNA polymerase